MNLLDQIENVKEVPLSTDNVTITRKGVTVQLTVDFFRVGKSIYARNALLSLTAGSEDQQLAKEKALMRLVGKVFAKILAHKRNSSISTLIPETTLGYPKVLGALEAMSLVLPERLNTTQFNVLSENLESISDGVFEYRLKKVDTVSQITHVQDTKAEALNKSKAEQIERVTITQTDHSAMLSVV